MNERELKTNSTNYNNATKQRQLIHEEYNSAYNHHVIVEALREGRAYDMVDYPRVDRTPAIIIGSGPSFDEAIPYLVDWEGGIFCTTSHARTLMYFGIEPTHIVALDPFCTWAEIEGVDWAATDTKLIAHPGVWDTLIHNWPNEMILFRQNLGNRMSFYAQQQQRMYSRRETTSANLRDALFHYLIRTEMKLFACSPPAQLFAADRLGYGTIFLSGVDFSYHHGKTRFTEMRPDAMGKWEAVESPMPDPIPEDYIRTDTGAYSEQIHLYYKKNFLTAWRESLQNLVTTDRMTALAEIPYMDIRTVVERQGKGVPRMKPKDITRITEAYLAEIGCFVIDGGGGNAFIESDKPLEQIPLYMAAMNRQYICMNCGFQAPAPDDNDHTGTACPQCPSGKLVRANNVDVAANMRRIERLVRQTTTQPLP